MQGRIFQALTLSLLALAGCQEVAAPLAERPTSAASAQPSPPSEFDAKETGSISGRVTWKGDLPKVPSLPMRTDPAVAPGKSCAHPNQPAIDPQTGAVAGAVVFLCGVDPVKSRPWDHPPVRIEMRELA